MKPCDPRWREELTDHALGLPASAALLEHLANCAVCPEVLRQWKAQMAQVDAGIQGLALSEPAGHAVSRIMAELRAQREHVWLPRWKRRAAAVGGPAILIAFFIFAWQVHQNRKEAERTLSAASAIGNWKSPTESLLRSPTDRWLKATPQFARYFYPLSTNVPPKEGEHP